MKYTDLLNITKEYGNPVYVYDAEKIKSQFNRLTNAFKTVKNLKINYCKMAIRF